MKFEGAGEAVGGQGSAVDCDVVQLRVGAADVEHEVEALVSRAPGDARQPHDDFTGAHVGQIAEGIHGDDILHIVRVALFGDLRGVALALAGDLEGVEFVDAAREIEVARGADACGDDHCLPHAVESEVGDDELMRADGHAIERVATGVISERGKVAGGDGDGSAFETVARRAVRDRAGDCPGVRRVGGCE